MKEINDEQGAIIMSLKENRFNWEYIGGVVGFTPRTCYEYYLKVKHMRIIEVELEKIKEMSIEEQTFECSYKDLLVPEEDEFVEIIKESKINFGK